MIEVPARVEARFRQRVGGDPDSCWEWPMSTGSHGYGQIGWSDEDGRSVVTLTHRVAWMIFRGPIPDHLTVDHLCRNRICCNPNHLRLLTNRVNGRANGHSIKTHCPAGHPYKGDNLYVAPNGHRRCRACAREYSQA